MATIKLELNLSVDGVPVRGFDPFIKTLSVDEAQAFEYEQADHGNATTFATLPITQVGSVRFLALRPTKQVTLRLDGQSDAGLVVNAEGLFLVLDGTIDAGSSTNATINNNAGVTAKLKGLGAGT